jgi:hypothetical protein
MDNVEIQPAHAELRPVLYLDLDDTLLSWQGGRPRAAPGARRFLLWALERFEVRWLTTWCPGGQMESSLLADLCTMLEVETSRLGHIRGFSWEATGSKLNGIAWLEHMAWERPFLWVEDGYGVREAERSFLAAQGFLDRYRHCNVTEDPMSLMRLHLALAGEWDAGAFEWEWRSDAPVLARAAGMHR